MPRTTSAARRWRADASACRKRGHLRCFACARGTMASGHLVEDHPSGANDGVPRRRRHLAVAGARRCQAQHQVERRRLATMHRPAPGAREVCEP